MPLIKEKTYTVDDIYALPEDERAELIDGQIYYMAPPSRKHQDISGELYADIKSYIRSHGGNCKVYAAPFAVYLDEATNTYVEPDISVICNPNKLDDKGCTGPQIGLLRLFLRPAEEWIIIRNCLNTEQPVLENIGLLMRQRIRLWCTISSTAIWRSIHCRILLKRGFMRIASLILGVWII